MDIDSKEFKEKIKEIVARWVDLPHYRLFIFGSRTNGKSGIRSDIDIGIEAEKPIPGNIKLEIESEFAELPVLQKIDFVDFKNVSNDFKEIALQNIEVIYEK